MHRLGYYDFSKDVQPTALALGEEHLYVFSEGYDFALIDTEHDGRNWLHVLNRISTTEPLDAGDSEDRSVIYEVAIPEDDIIVDAVVVDNMLIAALESSGIILFNITNPEQPVIASVITEKNINGITRDLSVSSLAVRGEYLYANSNSYQLSFDLTTPGTIANG
jgi:hypothetical protein